MHKQMYVRRKLCMPAHVCTHVKKGLLPNIMALSTLSIVAVCLNTSGQYNFTHHHFHTPTLQCPPSLRKKIKRSGLVGGNPCYPSWEYTLHTGPSDIILFQQSETTLTHRLEWLSASASCTSQKALPGHEWGDLQMNEISHFCIGGALDCSVVGTH